MNARLIFYPLFLLIAGAAAFWVWDTYYNPENETKRQLMQVIKPIESTKPSEEKEVQQLREAFLKGNYEVLETALQQAHVQHRKSITGRNFDKVVYLRLFDGLHSSDTLKATIDAWVGHYPDSAYAYLSKALYVSMEGWEIRGGDYSGRTYSNRLEAFGDKIKESIHLLGKSHELDPGISLTYEKLAVAFAYLGGNRALPLMQEVYDEAVTNKMDDLFYINKVMVSHAYLPRWGGNIDELKEYVYFMNKDVSADSLMPLLILDLHDELSFGMKPLEAAAYYQQPSVWNEVSQAIEHVIKAYPSAEWYSTYAALARKANKNDLVAEMLNKAFYADPYYFNNYYIAANMYMEGNLFDAAERYLNEYLTLEQNNYKPYDMMTAVQINLKRYDKAIDYATKGIALYSDECTLWVNRCIAYRELGQHDKALSDCNEAVNRRPACRIAYFHRSKLLGAMGRTQESDLDMTMYKRLRGAD